MRRSSGRYTSLLLFITVHPFDMMIAAQPNQIAGIDVVARPDERHRPATLRIMPDRKILRCARAGSPSVIVGSERILNF